ncbi:MAG TPA: ABC transporter permease [Candidatus Saccharimonadales bacterium]|nr:ABC transporter permease [Candidatus Saccharimonadales bacterium]
MRTIVRLTLLEAVRRRLLWAFLGLTVVSVAVTGWGFDRLASIAHEHDTSDLQLAVGLSQVLILVAFMFSFVLAMTAGFMAAPAIGGEIESGVAQTMLSRPLRRSEYLLGKWLGLSILIAGYALAAGFLELVVVHAVSGYWPPDPILAVGYLTFEAIVLLTLALVLGTRLPSIAGGAIVVVVYGLTWLGGVTGGVGAFFKVPALVTAADVSHIIVPVDGLWRGVVYGLEPSAMFLLGDRSVLVANPFFASSPPSPLYLVWSVVWLALVLGTGIWLLRRREI